MDREYDDEAWEDFIDDETYKCHCWDCGHDWSCDNPTEEECPKCRSIDFITTQEPS